jgi:sensor histidine kinase YesM
MQRLTYRTAFFLALAISLLLNVLSLIMFLYFRNSVMSSEGEHLYPPITVQMMISHLIFNFIITLIHYFILYVLNFRLLASEIKPKLRIPLLIVSIMTATMILSFLFSHLQIYFSDYGLFLKPFIRGNMMRDLFMALIIMLTSQLMYLSNKQQQTALENKTLISENMRTRYEALKNQVDPHFLFNSLNTLNALIKIDADKAQQYVQQLSYVFRYTLQNKEIISLEEELKFTQAYCHLMQIRYGDSLRFVYEIDSRFHHYSVIPLSLQILVENAIKHNVVTARQPLTISFVTSDDGTISVSNPIQLKKEVETGEGIGLVNLAERYRLMWQREIVITQNDGIFNVKLVLNEQNKI